MAGHDDVEERAVRTVEAYEKGGADAVATGHAGFVFACGGAAGRMSLFDTNSGETVISLEAAAQVPGEIAVASDGVKAAYGTATGAVYVWDVLYPSSMESFRADEGDSEGVSTMCWHPRGHVLAVGTRGGMVFLWDLVVGALLYPIQAHEGPVVQVQWTANGRLLVTAGVDGVLRVWNPRNVEMLGEVSSGSASGDNIKWHSGPLTAMDTMNDMSRIALTGSENGTVLLSVLKPEETCGVFHAMTSHRVPVTAVRFAPLESPKPLRSASAARDGSIHLFDMDRRLPMGKFSHSSAPVTQLEFSDNADVLFSAAGSLVRAWDTRVSPDEERPITFGGHDGKVSSFTISNAGASLVTACTDGKLRTFDMRYPYGDAPISPKIDPLPQ